MRVLQSEEGISLLELAIMLPVLLLLISGMIDMGFAINRVKSVVSASRQSARIAASHAKYLGSNVSCGQALSSNCTNLAPLESNPSVTVLAAHAACSYMEKNSPPRENWSVDIPRPEKIFEDGKEFRTTTVSIEYVGRPCFICFHEIFANFDARSSSSFVFDKEGCG